MSIPRPIHVSLETQQGGNRDPDNHNSFSEGQGSCVPSARCVLDASEESLALSVFVFLFSTLVIEFRGPCMPNTHFTLSP